MEDILKAIENLPDSDVVVTQDGGEEYDVSGLVTDDLKQLVARVRELETQIARIRKWVVENPHVAGYIWRDDVLAFIDKLEGK